MTKEQRPVECEMMVESLEDEMGLPEKTLPKNNRRFLKEREVSDLA